MALDAIELHQVRVLADAPDAVGELVLLVNREQDIGQCADDQRTFQFQAPEPRFQRAAVLRQ